jgi:transcriptional adapter 2-alpha
MLRKRIQELQTYRRLGLRSAGDIEKYDADLAKRVYLTPILVVRSDSPDFFFEDAH